MTKLGCVVTALLAALLLAGCIGVNGQPMIMSPGTRVRVAVTDRHALTCFYRGLRADVRA